MDQNDLSLDLLLQETLALTEYLRASTPPKKEIPESTIDDTDYLLDLADSMISDEAVQLEFPLDQASAPTELVSTQIPEEAIIAPIETQLPLYPESPGIIYKIDNSQSTFCVRGFSTTNIREAFSELSGPESTKRVILKLGHDTDPDSVMFFETKTFELAEAVREQIINRRFPHQEDALCNISDPGFSWWMDVSQSEDGSKSGRFEIFFKSHGINRADKYIQLGPIGDGGVAALRMNQARTLLRSSFPISEFSCDDKSFSVASQKPDHLGFLSFKNIFLEGINNTDTENFPDNSMGRTLYYYFHELAIVRKFWIEVKTKLG